jgi:AbrB family looped-hinge helix DNA binding protein
MVIGKKGKSYGLVTVGERGQIVIPQEARNEFDIKPKEKLVVFGMGGKALVVLKAETLDKFLTGHMEHLASLKQTLKETKDQ